MQSIEKRAMHGFKGYLNGDECLFFPRLGAMTLDTMERAKYFGQRNVRSCGFCRLRNGRSVTRKARRQNPALIQLLFGWATTETNVQVVISQRAKARAKLLRHGWNYKRRCRLLDFADKCLVPTPDLPPTMFQGLLHFERMHTFFINYCTYLMELLSDMVDKEKYALTNEYVRRCHQFRDPITGRTHARLPSVLKMTHLTAERRCRAVFYWAHVLGTKAGVIVQNMRTHALAAVATLQLLLISVRGHRSYSKTEWETIFCDVGKEFFRNLELMAEHVEETRLQKKRIRHEQRPDTTRAPLPFKRQRR